MDKIYIIVEDGVVCDCYSTTDIEVEILDFDNCEETDKLEEKLLKIRQLKEVY